MNSGENKFYVYVHSRLHTGEPFYVGKGHTCRSTDKRGRNPHWKNIVGKDGGFHASIIAKDLDEDFAFLLECEVIDRYKRLGIKLVNRTNGGEGPSGARHSSETKARMSVAHKGRIVSPETREKLRVKFTGRFVSEETRLKQSLSHRGKRKPHSDQAKRNMSAAAKRRKN